MPYPVRKKLGDIFIDTFFQYAINLTGFTAANETQTTALVIQSDADFVCVHSVYDSGRAAQAAGTVPNFLLNGGALIKLTDGATQRDLTNVTGGVPATCLFGSAERPYYWPITHLFKANTPIQWQVQGQGLIAASVVRFVLGGFKIPINTL
jgi:hypothetical protein